MEKNNIKNSITETKKSMLKNFCIIIFIVIFTMIILIFLNSTMPKEYYNANNFDIKTIYSDMDYDNDLIDDYSDFVLGARKDLKNKPVYKSEYYADAYPPDNIGVCTDVIWRSFKEAGYSLKDMLDEDIVNNKNEYKEAVDSNIDFRRVRNLETFFKRYSESLTLDPDDYKNWQPGDIVVFRDGKHIGIISDKRNKNGIPYVIHNAGPTTKEEDYLTKSKITGHYRFNASNLPNNVLKPWKN